MTSITGRSPVHRLPCRCGTGRLKCALRPSGFSWLSRAENPHRTIARTGGRRTIVWCAHICMFCWMLPTGTPSRSNRGGGIVVGSSS